MTRYNTILPVDKYDILRYNMIWLYSTIWYDTIRYDTIRYDMMWSDTWYVRDRVGLRKERCQRDLCKATFFVVFILLCRNVLFIHIGIFLSSGRGSFLVPSAPGHAGSPPEHHGASVDPGRGPWHVRWGFKAASNHLEALRARRAIQAHANPRTRYRFKNVRRPMRYLGLWMSSTSSDITWWWKRISPALFLRQQLARYATTFSTIRYNLHDLGGYVVYSHARSCVEDITTRWLGLHLRPTAVRV